MWNGAEAERAARAVEALYAQSGQTVEEFAAAHDLEQRTLTETAAAIAEEWTTQHYLPVTAAEVIEALDPEWFPKLTETTYSFSNDALRGLVFGGTHEILAERYWRGDYWREEHVETAVNNALRKMGF